jgi:hypothetical protein
MNQLIHRHHLIESKEKKPDTGIVAKVGPGRQAGNGAYLIPQVNNTTTAFA